jgi:hypothetical protein
VKVSGPLDDAFLRIDRAGQHLANLKRRVKAYDKAHGEAFVIRVEGMTVSQPTVPSEPPPRYLGVLIGETVQNLRTALDYLVFGLAWFDSGPDIERKTQFPIEDRPQGFSGRRNSFLKGVSDEHVAAIERLQPYNGGLWLANLRTLSNLDKHNVLAVAAGIQGHGIVPVGLSDEHAKAAGGFRKPGDMGMYYKFPIAITFPDGAPVIEILQLLKTEMRSVLEAFKPEFERWERRVPNPRVTSKVAAAGPFPAPDQDSASAQS